MINVQSIGDSKSGICVNVNHAPNGNHKRLQTLSKLKYIINKICFKDERFQLPSKAANALLISRLINNA